MVLEVVVFYLGFFYAILRNIICGLFNFGDFGELGVHTLFLIV